MCQKPLLVLFRPNAGAFLQISQNFINMIIAFDLVLINIFIINFQERVEDLEREKQGGKVSPKKRKIEMVSLNSEKSEKIQKNSKKQKAEAINVVRTIIKTRSMSAKKDLAPDEKPACTTG